MAVDTFINLPDSSGGTAGVVKNFPLGGDGVSSPSARLDVNVTSNPGDATGGNNITYVRLDPTYISIINWIRGGVVNPGAPFDMSIWAAPRGDLSFAVNTGLLNINTQAQGLVWAPPPMLFEAEDDNPDLGERPQIFVSKPNVNLELVTVDLQIYQFNRRAREATPLEYMFNVLSRGSTSHPIA